MKAWPWLALAAAFGCTSPAKEVPRPEPTRWDFPTSIRTLDVRSEQHVRFAGSDGWVGMTADAGLTWDTTQWVSPTGEMACFARQGLPELAGMRRPLPGLVWSLARKGTPSIPLGRRSKTTTAHFSMPCIGSTTPPESFSATPSGIASRCFEPPMPVNPGRGCHATHFPTWSMARPHSRRPTATSPPQATRFGWSPAAQFRGCCARLTLVKHGKPQQCLLCKGDP